MALLEILTFPDPRLRKKSVEVKVVTPDIVKLAEDMIETMYDSYGIGLSAPQVGQSLRLLVTDTRPQSEGRYKIKELTELERQVQQPCAVINPVITVKRGKTRFEEGCLSLPSYYGWVDRYDFIEVEGLNLKGEKLAIQTDGLLSICIQHEIDHLDGKLFIDHLSPIKANLMKSKIKKRGYPEKRSRSLESSTKPANL